MADDAFLFPEIARDRELPAWRGRDQCVWSWCPGRFVVERAWPDGLMLLACTSCGHQHLDDTEMARTSDEADDAFGIDDDDVDDEDLDEDDVDLEALAFSCVIG